MAKSLEAFRTIGEVSDELDVPKHVLRFWEARFPQIKPLKRGGGRRFYRPEDMLLLKGIHHLLHNAGYTIKGVQKILRERGLDAVKEHAPDVDAPPGKAPRAKRAAAAAPLDTLTAIAEELEYCLALARGSSAKIEPRPLPRRRSA
jgi:DNA-binding transcriptional MerR regulator